MLSRKRSSRVHPVVGAESSPVWVTAKGLRSVALGDLPEAAGGPVALQFWLPPETPLWPELHRFPVAAPDPGYYI